MGKLAMDWGGVMAPSGPWSALVRSGATAQDVARYSGGGLVFLAAPYLEEVQRRKEWNAERSARFGLWAAAEMLRLRSAGVSAVCPALMQAYMCDAAPLVSNAPADMTASAWEAWARPLLFAAKVIAVPEIVGWDRCPVIWSQVSWALDRNVPVHVYAANT